MKRSESQINAEIEALYAEKEKLRKGRLWRCPACKSRAKIGSLEVVSFYYYSIEDWLVSSLCEIECPKCHSKSKEEWEGRFNFSDFKKVTNKDERGRII